MTVSRFIIIDDDPINNKLCRYLIAKTSPSGTEILDFISAENALAYISKTYVLEKSCPTVLLLDINMPDINGWEFLSAYETLPEFIHQQIDIYLLSSSVDGRDKDRAKQCRLIRDFIVKPLRVDNIHSIIHNMHSTTT
ncbi:MAG: response regulator [Bacteroidota bacterium]